nr:MFS transporter [Neolewinella agarilytica]
MISLGVCSYGFSQARYTLSEEDLTEMTDLPNAQRLSGMVGTEYQSDTEYKAALAASLGEAEARDFSSILLQKAADLPGTLILIGILSFIAAFHFSVGPIMWVLFSEIFPIGLRGVAIPFFALITSVTSYLVQQFFPWQLATMGGSSIFLFYALMVGVGLLILSRYLVETKNLTIEEIQEKLIRK